MGKAEIQSRINQISTEIKGLESELTLLTEAKAKLESTSLEIEYVLNGKDEIKSTYHLAGHKYDLETSDEEKFISDIEKSLQNEKDPVLEELSTKIMSVSGDVLVKTGILTVLNAQLVLAKD